MFFGHPDPLVRGTDPEIHTKTSRIPNTETNSTENKITAGFSPLVFLLKPKNKIF
jgi:hypothetical protein